MILQALTKHYEDLVAKGVLSAPGFGYAKINFALEIDEEGNLVSVQTLGSPDEKGRMIPQRMLLPSPVKRASNTLIFFGITRRIFSALTAKASPNARKNASKPQGSFTRNF